ncbi:hypothetical protein [Curtobacterium sp. 20TX0008]|uniref:hypothetical protein n=1 Tax=Curtobacterium sp. 20TX0008 TaxID=3022018 RepID=UPI00232B9ED4|nr:hypothetical protein [Curtobacterium sp. 20TX0008]MDB6425954.1 hypothetical protein [Curtobacterium sp. 20TX0008]
MADANAARDEHDDAERRRAIVEDFLKSRAAAQLAGKVGDDARTVAESELAKRWNIDRQDAWEAALRSAMSGNGGDSAGIASELEAAAARWDDGVPVRDLTVAESLERAAEQLSARFPSHQLQLGERTDSWGRWLTINWIDGPTEAEVQQVAIAHTGVQSDPDGAAVRYAFYGASTWRDFSADRQDAAARALLDAGIRRDDADPDFTAGLPEGRNVITVAGVELSIALDPSFEQLVRAILDGTSFPALDGS